jgi:hypothetical protein
MICVVHRMEPEPQLTTKLYVYWKVSLMEWPDEAAHREFQVHDSGPKHMNVGLSVLRLVTQISRDSAGTCTLEEQLVYDLFLSRYWFMTETWWNLN